MFFPRVLEKNQKKPFQKQFSSENKILNKKNEEKKEIKEIRDKVLIAYGKYVYSIYVEYKRVKKRLNLNIEYFIFTMIIKMFLKWTPLKPNNKGM